MIERDRLAKQGSMVKAQPRQTIGALSGSGDVTARDRRQQPLGQAAPVSEQRTMNLAMVPAVRIALAFVRSRHSQTVNTLQSRLRNATRFRRSRRRFSSIFGNQYSKRTLGGRPARHECPCQKQP